MNFSLAQSKIILKKTPALIQDIVEGLDEDWIRSNEGSSSWSVFDVLGHLIHGEKTDWIPRMRIILNDSTLKTFEPFDRFAQFENNRNSSVQNLLEEFASLRKENLSVLDSFNLNESELLREGIHPHFGKVNLKQLLASWVVHDLAHLAQINRVMAKQYRQETGPWQEYMKILQS